MRKSVIISTFFILCIIFLSGCGTPKGDPKQVLDNYYQNVKGNNLDAAYNLLTKTNKEKLSKDDFILYMNLNKETSELISIKTTKLKDSKNADIDGNTYKNAVEFDVVEVQKRFFENKESELSYTRSVVNDDGEWKVYIDKNYKEAIPKFYVLIGGMYLDGKGKDKNLNEAAKYFNKAIDLDKNNLETHYLLAMTYSRLKRYDESNQKANELIGKNPNNDIKSDTYTLMGINCEYEGDLKKAREYYKQAIEINPNNEYAKTNINRLK